MARRSILSLAVLAACVCVGIRMASSFVSSGSSTSLRRNVAMQAAAAKKKPVWEQDSVVRDIVPVEELDKFVRKGPNPNPPEVADAFTGEMTWSTGASNKISIITPELTMEQLGDYLSLTINFFLILSVFTLGGIIEGLRFFPDCLYW
eukprot:TRINITY_DN4550_c0_g3_i1.p1 TRINITY_DN4550_c0_g3~~TRINITY_DN4550_c0_g3_i1.p1  ORF type:complete len:148 (+),score=31.93 TRINITY_DN4550_c0_g3_i1:89-532(+)